MHKNLKIDGIDGIMFEDAEMTELKVRQFLQDTLELPDVLTMPFEYSFRIKRSQNRYCSIFVTQGQRLGI